MVRHVYGGQSDPRSSKTRCGMCEDPGITGMDILSWLHTRHWEYVSCTHCFPQVRQPELPEADWTASAQLLLRPAETRLLGWEAKPRFQAVPYLWLIP